MYQNLNILRFWWFEQLRLHIDLTELGHAATQLQQRLYAIQDAHVRKSNLLDELEFRMLGQCRNRLCHPEHGTDDIVRRVSEVPIHIPTRLVSNLLGFLCEADNSNEEIIVRSHTTAHSVYQEQNQLSPPNTP